MDGLTPADRLLLNRMRELYTSLTNQGVLVKGAGQTTGLQVGVSNIPDGEVTYDKLQDVSATDKILGRSSSGAGSIQEIACTSLGRAILACDDSAPILVLLGTALLYQPLDSDLTAIAALTTTSFGRALLTLADAAALRTAASVYSAAQVDAGFQPLDGDLSAIAALSTATYGRSLLTLASLAATQASLKMSVPLFDHHVDVGNGTTVETDLYSDTLAAGQLGANDDKIEAEYAGVFVSSATATRQLKIYFDGQTIFDSGALTLSLSSTWTIYLAIIRVSATVVRAMVSMTTEGTALAAYTAYTEVTGRTLSGTNVLKITGTAAGVGAASSDIVSKMGYVTFRPAA
jgi:hypothetical protein